jgi:hypothetical protein
VRSHQVPRDPLSNSGLTEELDVPIGTAAAYAVRSVPVAMPEEPIAAVLDGMRGSTFDSGIVVAVCTNGRLVGLAPIELLLAAPADAVLSLVEHYDEQVSVPFRRLTWQPRRSLFVGWDSRTSSVVMSSTPNLAPNRARQPRP